MEVGGTRQRMGLSLPTTKAWTTDSADLYPNQPVEKEGVNRDLKPFSGSP